MLRQRRIGIASIGVGLVVSIHQFVPSLAESISQVLTEATSISSPGLTNTDTSITTSETSITLLSEDSNSEVIGLTRDLQLESVETGTVQTPVRRIPPVEVTTTQGITMRIPQTVRVDPRAQSVFLPQIYAESLNSLMMCISSDSLSIDIGSQGLEDSIDSDELKVAGDRSENLVLSGDPQTVVNVLNGASGIRAFRNSGGVGNQSLIITLIDISRPSADTAFCERPAAGNRRTVTFLPLAIEQRISDGKIRLGK